MAIDQWGILGFEATQFIPVLPLVAALIIMLLGRRARESGGYVAVVMAGGSMLFAVATLIEALPMKDGEFFEQSWTWVTLSDGVTWEMGIYVDPISALMGVIVSFVGFLIVVYSIGYMHGDPGLQRYYAVISLFIGVMLGLSTRTTT